MVEINLNDIQIKQVEIFLLAHEEDIAEGLIYGFTDFSLLNEFFEVMIGRVPEG